MASGRRVLLVGWDAADWKIIQPLLDAGELPTLEKIVNGGVMGNLASIRPMLSPMLWTSIATGKRPYKHGVHGFTEPDFELGQPVAVGAATRQCAALWDILNHAGLKTHVVGWFATHPAEPLDGACVSDRFAAPAPARPDAPWPMPPGTVSPGDLSETLAGLRIRPEDIDGSVLGRFVPQLARINQKHDKRLYGLAVRLAECFSIHAAATWLIEHRPWDFAAVYYRTIDWICHDFMAFHPPKMTGVYEMEFELYRDVVAGAYRLHDRLLGRLLQLAGGDTTVVLVSDHGFQSVHRPAATPDVPAGIASWHRPTGILSMRGAGLKQDELIHGAGLLDITPTILTLFGLPVGRDMDGRTLVEAFAEPPEVRMRDSWEQEIRRTVGGAATNGQRRSADEERSLVRQFVELGYLEDPGSDPAEALQSTIRENRWNLARAYADAGRFAKALPLFEEVYAEWPEREDYGLELALCQLNLGLNDEAWETAQGLLALSEQTEHRLLLANIEYQRGRPEAALECLAPAGDTDSAELQNQLGLAYIRLRQWDKAEAAHRRALETDGDNPHAHLGLAHCHAHAGRYEEAAEEALNALGLKFDLPLAHYHLGVALARLGDEARSIQAFETCLGYWPHSPPAHRYLAVLRGHQAGAERFVEDHRRHLGLRSQRREEGIRRLAGLRREIAGRAEQRAGEKARRRAAGRPAAVRPRAGPAAALELLIVSGLPRSGTSLMMQMLEAGGMEILRDALRAPDRDNPRGYFEWQEIKKLPKDPRLIEQARGKAVKVISMLLPWLPKAHRYRVIFMDRTLEDVVASQEEMRRRGGLSADALHAEQVIEPLRAHREKMIELLRQTRGVELLEVDYAALLTDPLSWSRRVAAFAGLEAERAAAMAAAVAPELCHHRAGLAGV